jgi:D-arabinose 1-dehydrogenase-like Zn-dependent alcohol dehydrogenase
MRAAVLTAPNTDLQLTDRDAPRPGLGEVVIRVHACGICHSDVALLQGYYSFASFPRVPGHEVAGVVVEVGDGVTWPAVGARVGMPWLNWSCGHCRHCIFGNEILCEEQRITGVNVDGGYQELMLAPANYVAPLPDEIDFAAAAPLMCAGLTVFNGLRLANFQPGQRVAVLGLGGLGHLGVQYARAMGGRVAVVSSNPEKEAKALELGAELFIGPGDGTSGERLREWDGGADIILGTPPTIAPMNEAFSGLATDGTLVVLGVGPGDIQVAPLDLIMPRRRIIGLPSGSRHELRDTLEFAARHGITAEYTPYPLEAAREALEDTHHGRVPSRAVLRMN